MFDAGAWRRIRAFDVLLCVKEPARIRIPARKHLDRVGAQFSGRKQDLAQLA